LTYYLKGQIYDGISRYGRAASLKATFKMLGLRKELTL